MFEELEDLIQQEKDKNSIIEEWGRRFKKSIQTSNLRFQSFFDKDFINKIGNEVPDVSKIGAVDGGILTEEMNGFDLILYRALGTVFQGIGSNVKARYIPNVNPQPKVFLSRSLNSSAEFSRIGNLLRLIEEYNVAVQVIEKEKPTVLFLDGKVTPYIPDQFGNNTSLVQELEEELKRLFKTLIDSSIQNNVLLIGLVKDSRSSELTQLLFENIPNWVRQDFLKSSQIKGWRMNLRNLQDQWFANLILEAGERTCWVRSGFPGWLGFKNEMEIISCLVKPIQQDQPIRVEVLSPSNFTDFESYLRIGLGALNSLTQHGLPIAVPTIIQEVDRRVRLHQDFLESTIEVISGSLGIPKEHLRKRRAFHSSLKIT